MGVGKVAPGVLVQMIDVHRKSGEWVDDAKSK
jgi:hypothetical protein